MRHLWKNRGFEMKQYTVLSLFDGISTLQLAMKRMGIPVKKYYASEIDKKAVRITAKHFPETIHLGDVRKWRNWKINWESIDLIASGSPCQDLSKAGSRTGIYGKKSRLFFVFADILEYVRKINPNVYFLQENVAYARPGDIRIISEKTGVYPQMIDSALFVPQRRKRLFWSNISTRENLFGEPYTAFSLPGKKIRVKPSDILTSGLYPGRVFPVFTAKYISANTTSNMEKFLWRIKNKSFPYVKETDGYRLLNIIEMNRIQGFPDDYVSGVSDYKASQLLGNAWTLPVIEHIVKHLSNERTL